MLENLNKKQKIILGVLIIFMLSIIIYYIYSSLSSNEDEDNLTFDNFSITNNLETKNVLLDEKPTETEDILVHISGCVKENKVVSLPIGSRVNDAIEAAGGLTDDADLSSVNLAYILEDGEKIYIPKKGEEISNADSISNNSLSLNKKSKININTATQAELEFIPGIGPSIALKIITYRNENGKFKSIEDVKNISGIGDNKFEKMKDYISIK